MAEIESFHVALEPLGIAYRVASAVDLPFADTSFDFATGFMSFMGIPETDRVVSCSSPSPLRASIPRTAGTCATPAAGPMRLWNMSTSPRPYLQHMLTETQYLMDQTQRLEQAPFLRDETLKRAFARSLEILGEAVKQLLDDVKQRYSHLEWRAMAGMCDRLIHGYFGVDYDIVWDVVTNKIPELQQAVEHILGHEDTH